MMTITESTSAEALNKYLPGKLIAASNGWKNLLVRIYSEPRVEESVIYPAVAEPRMVRILSGAAAVEDREPGGPWLKTLVQADDFFLTASQSPYEVRWRAIGPEPFNDSPAVDSGESFLILRPCMFIWGCQSSTAPSKRRSKPIREQRAFGTSLGSRTIFCRRC